MGFRPRLAIDWDGTCVENKWPAMGDWLPGAIEGLHTLSQFATVIIHTSRIAPLELDERTPRPPGLVQGEINRIREMLDEAGLTGVEVWNKPWKPGATAYLDDKAVRFPGRPGSWKAVVPVLAAKCKQQLKEEDDAQ